ncbi:GTP-binding protein [Myroides odoratus]|uniref:GTP-binding protein n=1 Tax=Myroides odoratus TaxID=256 RepID=UPI00333F3850
MTNPDIRSTTLLEGLKKMKDEFQNELVENILEISYNSRSIENLNQLKRIERAAEQYQKRTNNIFYIGFLGHFSSGKSSTINTLLKLQGTINEKKSDHNPTDDQITLITSTKNNEDVIKLTRSGQVPVIVSLVDSNSSLDDKVIMDTPGSGDPETFEEIVRDSLPLCDLIIYCMAATHPLTNSDIPLLKEKEKHLTNIPTIYLITRGNEFKKNNLEPLNKSNFDDIKYQTFASELSARIKQVVNSIDIDYKDFIIIDNKEVFNIEILEEKISLFCNAENYGNILRLHDHKVDYFTRTLKEIKSYFIQLIATKLDTIEKYFTQAKAKLDDYEQKTLIGTDKMVNSWRSIDEKIKQVLDGSINQNNLVYKSVNTQENFLKLPTVLEGYKKYSDINTSLNKQKTEIYQTQIKSTLIDLNEKVKNKLFHLLDNGEMLSTESIQDEIKLQIPKTYFNNVSNYDTVDIYKKINTDTFDYLDKIPNMELRKQMDSLKGRTKNANPLESILKYITEAKTVLNEIFETYKNGVKIYTVAAFSIEAKSYIKNLGLSDELDLIDNEEPDINSYLAQTETEIFKDFNNASNKFETTCTNIYLTLNEIVYNSPILTEDTKMNDLQADEEEIINSYNEKFLTYNHEINNKIQNYFSSKIQLIHNELVKLEVKRDSDLEKLKKKRIYYYLKRFIPFIIILCLTFVFFYILPKFNFLNNLSIGYQWLFGILVNASSALLTTIVSRKKDKHEIFKSNIEKTLIKGKKDLISEILNRDFESFKIDIASKQSSEINNLLNQQSKDILELILSDKFNSNIKRLHSKLLSTESSLRDTLTEYSTAINEFKGTCSKVLNNTTINKDVLLKQSKLIKENSISPSFRLLEQTRNNIAKVKIKIEQIDFI